MAYEWSSKKLACVATYNVLEGDRFLDEFEDADIPFDKAADVNLKTLRYFPKTTANKNILEVLSIEQSRAYLKHIAKTFTIKKQNKQMDSAEIIEAVAKIFKDGEKTIRDLARLFLQVGALSQTRSAL